MSPLFEEDFFCSQLMPFGLTVVDAAAVVAAAVVVVVVGGGGAVVVFCCCRISTPQPFGKI